jgi:aspartate kinase
MNNTLVFKFGGASVKDAEGIKTLAEIVRLNRDKQLLIVVSAIDKTTNRLEELTRAYMNRQDNTGQLLSSIKAYHEEILNNLFNEKNHAVYDTIANTFVEIEWMLEEEPHDDYAFVYDQIVSIGELVSTKIVSAYLNHEGLSNHWLDARNFIHTDNTYREGKVDWEKTCNSIQQQIPGILNKQYVVTQGFIGGTSENYTTTLGREGSDYSAAIFASCLRAESVTIWKDVPGVLNADPKLFPDTVKYDELSYTEALEMTYYGATVIHPKTIKPLQNANIPLLVKSFIAPEDPGTMISEAASISETSSIIIKNNQVFASISTKNLAFINEECLRDIFKIFAHHHIKINTMQVSAISFSTCFDWDEERVSKVFKELEKDYNLNHNTGLKLITIRHYTEELINKLTGNNTILLKQLSRNTAQLVINELRESGNTN